MVTAILHAIFQIIVILAMPPLLLGVIAKTKAVFGGRVGPPVLQLYFDLARLLRKRTVFSRTTSWVFRAGPIVGLVAVLCAAALVPVGDGAALVGFRGDFIALAYLFGLSRYFTMAAALDTGSAFEGMGAAREATFACLTEPAFILGLLALARATSSMSLGEFLGPAIQVAWGGAGASFVLVTAGLLVVTLAETSRIPVDDPNTHLELTMIHEVMVLDHSGPPFAMILYSSALRLFLFAAILIRIVIPVDDPVVAWLALAGGVVVISIAIGVIESTMARLRLTHVPAFLLVGCLLSALAVVLLAR